MLWVRSIDLKLAVRFILGKYLRDDGGSVPSSHRSRDVSLANSGKELIEIVRGWETWRVPRKPKWSLSAILESGSAEKSELSVTSVEPGPQLLYVALENLGPSVIMEVSYSPQSSSDKLEVFM